jgi:hypothetical protein
MKACCAIDEVPDALQELERIATDADRLSRVLFIVGSRDDCPGCRAKVWRVRGKWGQTVFFNLNGDLHQPTCTAPYVRIG